MKAKNNSWAKRQNKFQLLQLLMEENLSRVELTEKSGFSGSTVSLLTSELLMDGLITEKPDEIITKGRPRKILSINKEYGRIVVFYVTPKIITLNVLDFSSNTVVEIERQIEIYDSYDVYQLILSLLEENIEIETLKGIVLFFSEEISPAQQQVYLPELGFDAAVHISHILTARFNCPVQSKILDYNAFWQALPEEESNCMIVRVSEKICVQIKIDGQEISLNPDYACQNNTGITKLQNIVMNLFSVFSLQVIFLYAGKSGPYYGLAQSLKNKLPARISRILKFISKQAQTEKFVISDKNKKQLIYDVLLTTM